MKNLKETHEEYLRLQKAEFESQISTKQLELDQVTQKYLFTT